MNTSEYHFIRHFEANAVGRDFIVGDIHGCFEIFNNFLTHLKFDSAVDRMFSVGDLMDRGPDSLSCALLIYQDWFHCVRGNHEQMMIDFYFAKTSDGGRWFDSGGMWAKNHPIGDMKNLAMELMALPFIITVGEGDLRFNVVHAEMTFDPDVTDEKIDQTDLLDADWLSTEPLIWGRDLVQGHPPPHNPGLMSLTYCGHTPLEEPVMIGRQMYLDGGAVFAPLQEIHLVQRMMLIAEHKAKVVHKFAINSNQYSVIPYSDVPVAT